MAYVLKLEHYSQHLRPHLDYGSYSFPEGRREDEEPLFRVDQRPKEETEVQQMYEHSAVVAADHYCWTLFQAVALRDFKTLYSPFPDFKAGLTVVISFLRDSWLTCSVKKWWRLCCLPRQPAHHVSLLHNLMLLPCNLRPLVLEVRQQFVFSVFAAISMCLKKVILSPPSNLNSKLSNPSFPVHHREARLLLAGDSWW